LIQLFVLTSTMANQLGVARNERTKHFDVTYAIHLRIELIGSEWDHLYSSPTLVEFAKTATMIYMAFQSVPKKERIAMIMTCFDQVACYISSGIVWTPVGCPLSDEQLDTLVYTHLKEFVLVQSLRPDIGLHEGYELEIDRQRQLFEALLDKAAEATVTSGDPLLGA
jgi:hypothetical protein